ncbi:MAG TPA: PilT/PilU family type 4a pilus ATPase [bacterium]|nr:PilT/PilU family type 4a pilus ATPase [bacterium]
MHIQEFLSQMVERKASDIHIKVGRPPLLRINGALVPLDIPALTGPQVEELCRQILSERQLLGFDLKNEIDTAYHWEGVARFRANIFRQKSQLAMVMRVIPANIPSLDDLDVPPVYKKIATSERGLVLVTGSTGSGKSTSLAAMLNEVNQFSAEHIVTIEDPIEFVHPDKMGSVCQREVGLDTETFGSALRYLLRQDPDVVLIGEMRDTETVRATVSAAETGHMVFSTLHTNDTVQTLDRILDFFPSDQQGQIRQQLASALRAVICQRLVLRADGTGRIPAAEVMVVTPVIKSLILENRFKMINQYIKDGEQEGMMSFDQCLIKLFNAGKITRETALNQASSPAEVELAFKGVVSSRASAQSMLDQMNTSQGKADIDRSLKKGADLMRKGMNEEAASEFKRVLRDDPNNTEAKNYLAQLSGKADNEVTAVQSRAILRRGLELFQADNIDEAVKVWEEVLKADPANAQAKAYIKSAQERKISQAQARSLAANGVEAYQAGDIATALRLWEQALAADSRNEQVEQYLVEGRRQLKLREIEMEAQQHFVNGATFYQASQVMEAGREWSWALKLKPDYKEAAEYLAQAKAYATQDLADTDPAAPDASSVQQSYKAGVENFMSLKFKEATGFFNQAKAKRPTHLLLNQMVDLSRQRQREYLDSYLAKGKLAFEAGDLVEALKQWKLAVKEAPDDALTRKTLEDHTPKIHAEVDRLYAKASELFNKNQNKEAITLFDQILALDATHEFAHKKREEAREKIEKLKGILNQMKA